MRRRGDNGPSRTVEGRFEFSYGAEGGRRIEIAPGFHSSATHVGRSSVPSRLFSLDWFLNPLSNAWSSRARSSRGQNVMNLGTGGIRQGFVRVRGPAVALPVHSKGGWAQLTWLATPTSFNFFGGQEDDRDQRPAWPDASAKIKNTARNFFYRLAPNVLVGFEASHLRTTYIRSGDPHLQPL